MADMALPITGGCQCGAVRYEITEAPTEVGYCHCRMCQRAVGNLFATFAEFPTDAVQLTQGEVKYYKSSTWMKRGFCPDCGTPLMCLDDAGMITVQIGSFDQPEKFRPQAHFGIESKVPWLDIRDDLPRVRTEDELDFIAKRQAQAVEKSGT